MESVLLTAALPASRENKLLRILGVGFGLAIVIGGMIGVGILRTPGIVAANLGDAWLIIGVWILGGVYALIGANSFSELATMLPKSGGQYVYIRRAYGNFLGFAGGTNDFVANCCGTAFIVIAFGEYTAALVPAFVGLEKAVTVVVLLGLFFIHWTGLRTGDLAQKMTSLVKVAAFFVLIIACFVFGANQITAPEATAVFANPLAAFAAAAISMQAVMQTYAGWSNAVYFSEENRDPARAIPRSMFTGVLIVTAIYVSVNAALLYALPMAQIAQSKLPVADAAASVFGEAGGKFITVLSLASLLGVLNAKCLCVPRILFAMSRDGFLPSDGAKVNSGGTPTVALLSMIVLTMFFALSGTFETLLAIAAFLNLASLSVCYLALFVLRRKEPDLPRPFRAFGYPVLPAIVLVGAWILLIVYVVGNTTNSLYAIGMLLLLYPAFLIVRRLLKT